MRIGIDCDGVLRDFIPCLIDGIKETHPQHTNKILVQMEYTIDSDDDNALETITFNFNVGI